jgi:8-oxo-dGTP diphosphatase
VKRLVLIRVNGAGVAGYIEENETPIQTALKEISEEVGLAKSDVKLIKEFEPVKITDFYKGKRYDWEIFFFVFEMTKKGKIKIDWEHFEYRWIEPFEIEKYDTVPYLKEIVKKLFL